MIETRAPPGFLVKGRFTVDKDTLRQVPQPMGTDKYFPNQTTHHHLPVIESGLYDPQEVDSCQYPLISGLQRPQGGL